jgi:superfamily II DNA or RNA helicase
MVLGPSISELTEQGFLVPAEVYAPPSPVDMTGVRKVGGDYAKGEVAARMDKAKITGDAVDHYRRLANGKAAVAFCCSIKHAEAVADQFRGQGIRAASIDGKMEKADRKGRIDALRSREIQVLTSCDVISEGLDIPLIEVGILLRPTESLSLYLQQIGRCLRPYPGKRFATILDHVGNSLKFGLPDEPRDWQLSATESSESEKKGLALRTCPKCLAIFRPAPECPRCGAPWETQERQVQQVAGELEKVTKEDREAARLAANREVQEARDRKALEAIAAARGYKGQWVDYVLAARAKKSVRPPIHESGTIAQWKGDEPT